MSTPLILGAALLELAEFGDAQPPLDGDIGWPLTFYGAAVAAVVGYYSLKLLVAALKGRWFWLFGPYCIVVGLLTLLFA
jgi:undecaprenyl-diphosphatase